MTAGVYAIVNTADGRAYVGSSVNIEVRWAGHRSALKRGTDTAPRVLAAAWAECGGVGFEWRILEEVQPDDGLLLQAEQRWIDDYGDRAYNVARQARRPACRQRREPVDKAHYLDLNGLHLQRRRESLGISVQQFAAKMGVSASIVGQWEHGEAPMGRLMWLGANEVLMATVRSRTAARMKELESAALARYHGQLADELEQLERETE